MDRGASGDTATPASPSRKAAQAKAVIAMTALTTTVPPAPRLHADTTWFHMFRAFVFGDDCARLGPYATTVLLVVKAHTNFTTGCAFPSIETIVERSSISRRQVIKSLQALEEAGYLVKARDGRKNTYQVREKIHLLDGAGRPAAVATWDYLPTAVKETCAQLKSFLFSGKLPDGAGAPSVVYIEQLSLNLQVVEAGGTGTQVNGGGQ